MRDSLSALCDSFIENRDILRETFGWENVYLYPVCGAVFMDKRKTADGDTLRYCKDLLKQKTGIFSEFRNTAKLSMIAMMAADENPEARLDRALQIYDSLKKYFWSSPYLPIAAMIIAERAAEERYEEITARTKEIYDMMKKVHPFLTSGEDSVFTAMLALSELSAEEIIAETEECYQYLKGVFSAGNAVQTLSHVLTLGQGAAEEKCRKTADLFMGLKSKGYHYSKSYELATLGVLAMIPAEQEKIIEDMIEVDDYLAGQKGYGLLGIGKKQRLMHASMIVASDYTGNTDNQIMISSAIGGNVSLIVAHETAMCAAIAASSAAAASSSSNS